MSGKILFIGFKELTPEIIEQYDLKLHITRSTKKGLKRDFIHVPQLSPSNQLLNTTMYKWKKLKFTKNELEILKKSKTGTWFDLFTIEFEKEMQYDSFIKNYNRLKHHLDNGVNILAVCYCEDAYKCHRSLIHKRLVEEGYNSILK